jgi:hypothetical protein
MSDATDLNDRYSRPAKRAWLSVSWIVVLGFIAVSAVLLPLELRARWGHQDTRTAIEVAWNAAEARGEKLSKQDFLKCLRGSPACQKTAEGDLYTWSGVLQTYRMLVKCREGRMVQKVTWN